MRQQKYRTQIEAVRASNKGKRLTKKHKTNISKGFDSHISGQVVAFNGDEIRIFKNCAECARFLGVTRQMVSQCIKRPDTYKHAKGWSISLQLSLQQINELAKEGGAI